MALLRRIQNAMQSGRAAIEARTQPASEPPDSLRNRTALLLCGVPVRFVSRNIREEASILITDSREVSDFQLSEFNTEYIPSLSVFDARYGEADVLAYVVRRLAILRVKWRLNAVYVGGDDAVTLAEAWARDPEGPQTSFFRKLRIGGEVS